MATYTGIKKIKIGDNTFELAVDWSAVTSKPTIPTNTDENVKSNAVTAATTTYIVGSTLSDTTIGHLSKHASAVMYVTANSGTSGYTQLRLGNTTATSSAGGKEGQIRLYGTTATYYVDLKAGAPSANRTITFPNATGTVALTSDIPTTLPASDVYSWAKASTKPTYTASEVGALASDTTYVSKITTTAGAHTAISNKSGAVSFNVPTKTSHLTNDSGFITSYTDTNTTYALSGALSSHKFTSTLTAGGSGSGTSTSDFTLAAGTGITITDDTSNRKMTIACSVTNTDTKVSISNTEPTSGTWYFPTWHTASSGTGVTLNANDGIQYYSLQGTASALGQAYLKLGNGTAEGTAGNKFGGLQIYSVKSGYATLRMTSATTSYTIYLPAKAGTLAVTDDIPTKTSQLQNNSGFITDAGVTSITTTAGSHSTKTSATGAVSFKVPTHTSHLTNDSNFVDYSYLVTRGDSSYITMASGVTLTELKIYIYGHRIAHLFITVKFSTAQTAGTSYDIGTLASSVRPINVTGLTSTYGAGQITAGGVISCRPQLSLSANSNRTFSATYLLNTTD